MSDDETVTGVDGTIEADEPMAKVIELRPKREPIIRQKQRDPNARYCTHQRVGIDANRREVWCLECKTTLDPIDAFIKFARRGDQYLAMQRDAAALRREIEQLKAERAKHKQAIRRATRPS